jgi:hypothetical protein
MNGLLYYGFRCESIFVCSNPSMIELLLSILYAQINGWVFSDAWIRILVGFVSSVLIGGLHPGFLILVGFV